MWGTGGGGVWRSRREEIAGAGACGSVGGYSTDVVFGGQLIRPMWWYYANGRKDLPEFRLALCQIPPP